MRIAKQLPGITLIFFIASISFLLATQPILMHLGLGALVIAILLGITLGNSWQYPSRFNAGIQFSAKRILRLAIVLYGFRVSFQQIIFAGWPALVLDTVIVSSVLIFGSLAGIYVFKLDKKLALLISAGTAICGAAAVLAVEDIIKSEPYQTSVAIGTVVLFGTLAMFIYPLLQQHHLLGLDLTHYGLFTGASVHEVAQVVVAGMNIDPSAAEIAVVIKMLRVLLLVPVLFILSYFIRQDKQTRITTPWFALGFIAVIAIHSMLNLPSTVINTINSIDLFLLAMAMGAIGMETKLAKIKKVGLKPLYLAIFLVGIITSLAYVLIKILY